MRPLTHLSRAPPPLGWHRHTNLHVVNSTAPHAHTRGMGSQVGQSLWARVLEVYDAAQASGAAMKTDTRLQQIEDAGVSFVLRVVSALRSKPTGISSNDSENQRSNKQQQPPAAVRNPFLPYEEELWVDHLSDSHTLLLNKFNVVPHHVLVVTRMFESQQDPLNARDLAATQQVLQAMPHGGVAFYNCGEHSGRSQPHKHVQVVPLPFIEEVQAASSSMLCAPVESVVMAAQTATAAAPLQPFELRQLPFRAYAAVLMPSTTAAELEAAAGRLLELCQVDLSLPVSYNVIMTCTFIMMVPRRQEMCGRAAINALGFAGTILLKSEEDLLYARQQGPMNMLAAVGHPWEPVCPAL